MDCYKYYGDANPHILLGNALCIIGLAVESLPGQIIDAMLDVLATDWIPQAALGDMPWDRLDNTLLCHPATKKMSFDVDQGFYVGSEMRIRISEH